jgi:hypothetical protein
MTETCCTKDIVCGEIFLEGKNVLIETIFFGASVDRLVPGSSAGFDSYHVKAPSCLQLTTIDDS